jgi:hypothetical protein
MQSNITNELHKRFGWLLWRHPWEQPALTRRDEFLMHDFLIALVFVAMVASPAIVASSPKSARNEDC